jgi:hypothetical protein
MEDGLPARVCARSELPSPVLSVWNPDPADRLHGQVFNLSYERVANPARILSMVTGWTIPFSVMIPVIR